MRVVWTARLLQSLECLCLTFEVTCPTQVHVASRQLTAYRSPYLHHPILLSPHILPRHTDDLAIKVQGDFTWDPDKPSTGTVTVIGGFP